MADQFQLEDSRVLVANEIQADGSIYTSPEQNNNSGTTFNSLKCVIDYEAFNAGDNSPMLTAVVEGRSDGGSHWFPTGYQFNPLRTHMDGPIRQIILQPSLFWPDAGVDNHVWIAGKGTIAQISNTQIALTVCLAVIFFHNLRDTKPLFNIL